MKRGTKIAAGLAAAGSVLLLAGWGGTPVVPLGGLDKPGGGGAGGGGSNKPGGGGGGGGPGSVKPKPGPGGKGTVYGNVTAAPKSFDMSGNGLWISPACDAVVVGERFYPNNEFPSAIEPQEYEGYVAGKEVEAVQKVDKENSIMGFIDWMFKNDRVGDGSKLGTKGLEFFEFVTAAMRKRGRPRPLTASVTIFVEMLKQVSQDCIVRLKPAVVDDAKGEITKPEIQYPREIASLYWGEALYAFMADFLAKSDAWIRVTWTDEIAFELGKS